MTDMAELFQPPRFPGDDYVIRMNSGQVFKLCTLMHHIKQVSPEQFEDADLAMLELQLAHQAYMHNMAHGDDATKAFAAKILPDIRHKQAMLAAMMARQ